MVWVEGMMESSVVLNKQRGVKPAIRTGMWRAAAVGCVREWIARGGDVVWRCGGSRHAGRGCR